MQIKPPGIRQNDSDNADKDLDEYDIKLRGLAYNENRLLYWIRFIFYVFAAFLCLGVVSIYMLHLVGSEGYRWLPDTDIAKLKDLALTIIVGLILSAATSNFFRKNKK